MVAADAADVAATKALIHDIQSSHGRLDVLFVNAGIARFMPSSDVDEDHFDAQFNVNVRGAYFAIRSAAEAMSDGGLIILTASVSGVRGGHGQTVYGATKAAVRSFGRTFTAELAPRHPGQHHQPRADRDADLRQDRHPGRADGGHVGDMLKTIPLARVGCPEEVAAAALFLASADSSFTTAGELFVDGGMAGI